MIIAQTSHSALQGNATTTTTTMTTLSSTTTTTTTSTQSSYVTGTVTSSSVTSPAGSNASFEQALLIYVVAGLCLLASLVLLWRYVLGHRPLPSLSREVVCQQYGRHPQGGHVSTSCFMGAARGKDAMHSDLTLVYGSSID